jgi:hypothetical protein
VNYEIVVLTALIAMLSIKINSNIMHVSTPRSNLLCRFLSVFILYFSFSAHAGTDQTGRQKVTVIAQNIYGIETSIASTSAEPARLGLTLRRAANTWIYLPEC